MKANKRNIRKLVVALRGGKYHQTQNKLCEIIGRQTFHCCLGVGCRLAIKDGVKIKVNNEDPDDVAFNGDTGEGPQELHDWLGISDDEARVLANMNDRDNSFREIADYLEKKYLK